MSETALSAGTAAKTAVLVAPAPHPVSGRPCAGPGDLAALALARRLGRAFVVLHAGDADKEALADYLAQGAAAIAVLQPPADSDPTPALIAALGCPRPGWSRRGARGRWRRSAAAAWSACWGRLPATTRPPGGAS
ncbi:hypothetical protein [Chromobacterium sp. Panama]|uniref:hypothetical protein n=1 Tax=Chromobacterium sp. Panama TaxID=2161826 RepID=UPI001E40FB64|nr:hypothetical protein [Chromobacterium sp. Panama]